MFIRSFVLLFLSVFLLGCETPALITIPIDPQIQFDRAKIEAHQDLLQNLKDKIYVLFDEEDCPVGVFEPIDQCPLAFGNPDAVCRGEPGNPMGVSTQAKFHTSVTGIDFGLRFDFHPCSQPASTLENLNPDHTCAITPKSPKITEILKYTIIGPGTCPEERRELDPYFIVVR
jgi:hypothetical protein